MSNSQDGRYPLQSSPTYRQGVSEVYTYRCPGGHVFKARGSSCPVCGMMGFVTDMEKSSGGGSFHKGMGRGDYGLQQYPDPEDKLIK